MLALRRIEIDNFACFDNVVVEPSTDSQKPLTVLRAENGSGKTTFLRALRWGMYGERGLPGNSQRFSLHPAWWHPGEGDGIKTKVQIEFETDGSTRHTGEISDSTTTVYQLVRSVTTIGELTTRDDEPDFRRINERTELMVREGDGVWTPHTSTGVDIVVDQILPWGLRDFFVMDADEATDFVGGSENKAMDHQAVIRKTTAAVHSLLGLDVFRSTSKRVEKMAREFGAQVTKAIGDADLDALQKELNLFRSEKSELTEKISGQQARRVDFGDRLRKLRSDRDTELKNVGAAGNLRTLLCNNHRNHSRTIKQQKAAIGHLAASLGSIDLLAALTKSEIAGAYDKLRPLYERGDIPLKHLTFVRDLLESRTCVCGQDLSEDGVHRRHVEAQIAKSEEQERHASYLGQLHDSAKSLMGHVTATGWEESVIQREIELAEFDRELSRLALEKREVDDKLKNLDEEKINVIQGEIEALETQLDNVNRDLGLSERDLSQLSSKIASYEKQIGQRQRKERAAADKQVAEKMARLVGDVLTRAYNTIQSEQVSELSQRMDRLFAQMAANVSDDDFDQVQRSKATLKMIAEVGLRPVDGKQDDYEIYALNSRGRSMPAIEINGASRRVLALSFVLALCAESKTYAPLIADSLLNFMSGTVRRNTLRVTVEKSKQPILLLTGSDLEASSEAETVTQYAGATYTLTGQWDAIDAGDGGDVVHWTEQRSVSLVCPCGPRQYCDVCERNGQAGSPGWSKRI